jgi:hypothetical protein
VPIYSFLFLVNEEKKNDGRFSIVFPKKDADRSRSAARGTRGNSPLL